MDSRKCGECELVKGLSEFYKRKSGSRRDTYYEKCKLCMKNRGRDYYHNTREHQLELVKIRVNKYKESRRETLVRLKNKQCADCKKYYPPWVMEFDHLDSLEKVGNVSHMYMNGSWNIDKLEAEIAKCELVCANCHRKRTYKRGPQTFDSVIEKLKVEGMAFLWENTDIAELAKLVTAGL